MGYFFLKKNNNAQASLEVSIIFVLAIIFFLGIIRIWIWGNAQFSNRQVAYRRTRVEAGTVENETEVRPLYWPVYKPKTLSEEWAIPKSPFKK